MPEAYIFERFASIYNIIGFSNMEGPDGESAAAMRYLSQRCAMPYKEGKAILTDVGTEELGHFEIIGAIVYQLTRNLTMEQIEESGFWCIISIIRQDCGLRRQGGIPFNACEFQSKGDPITDLNEDLAAEQKARVTYDNILR